MAVIPSLFDQGLIRRRRNRAAHRVAELDFLNQRAADDLCERLSLINREFCSALDLGAQSGTVGRALRASGFAGELVSLESAERLCRTLQGPAVNGDADALPFANGCFDLVLSGLWLHLENDLPGALIQIRRTLKPDGLLLASLLAGDTLIELKTAFAAAEAETAQGASPHVAPFPELRDLGQLLQRAGFALPVADLETLTLTYRSPFELMAELRKSGFSNALSARSRRPVTQRTLGRMAEIYAERFSNPDSRVRATVEIATLHGFVPHESQQKPLKPGSAKMPLADALKGK